MMLKFELVLTYSKA